MPQKPKDSTGQPPEEYANFDKAMRKAIAVPKSEIDKREAKWREKQTERKTKKEK